MILQGNAVLPEIEILVKKSLIAKATRICVNSTHQHVVLIIAKNATIAQAKKFLLEKESWIRKHLFFKKKHIYNIVSFEDNVIISVLGETWKICYVDTEKKVSTKDGICFVPRSHVNALQPYLYGVLKQEIIKIITRFSYETEGFFYNRITIRDTLSRWGSCSAKKNLSFCWKLIFLPIDLLEYVVAHEICHLLEMNHSSRFWLQVEKLVPDYKNKRRILKTHRIEIHKNQG